MNTIIEDHSDAPRAQRGRSESRSIDLRKNAEKQKNKSAVVADPEGWVKIGKLSKIIMYPIDGGAPCEQNFVNRAYCSKFGLSNDPKKNPKTCHDRCFLLYSFKNKQAKIRNHNWLKEFDNSKVYTKAVIENTASGLETVKIKYLENEDIKVKDLGKDVLKEAKHIGDSDVDLRFGARTPQERYDYNHQIRQKELSKSNPAPAPAPAPTKQASNMPSTRNSMSSAYIMDSRRPSSKSAGASSNTYSGITNISRTSMGASNPSSSSGESTSSGISETYPDLHVFSEYFSSCTLVNTNHIAELLKSDIIKDKSLTDAHFRPNLVVEGNRVIYKEEDVTAIKITGELDNDDPAIFKVINPLTHNNIINNSQSEKSKDDTNTLYDQLLKYRSLASAYSDKNYPVENAPAFGINMEMEHQKNVEELVLYTTDIVYAKFKPSATVTRKPKLE